MVKCPLNKKTYITNISGERLGGIFYTSAILLLDFVLQHTL